MKKSSAGGITFIFTVRSPLPFKLAGLMASFWLLEWLKETILFERGQGLLFGRCRKDAVGWKENFHLCLVYFVGLFRPVRIENAVDLRAIFL